MTSSNERNSSAHGLRGGQGRSAGDVEGYAVTIFCLIVAVGVLAILSGFLVIKSLVT